MFDEICSVYADALDNRGRYVDQETGEIITEMTIREFCLTDRWRPYVERLRALRAKYGDKAKKMEEYVDVKKHLPGATLSGRFALYEDESLSQPGRRVMVSRRETHLQQHTGWLAIDIDLGDNSQLAHFDNVRFVCQFRPEIALLMRSCSGTGYFGLVRLAYPDRHKEQFRALLKDYAAIGIVLDKQCGNIGRVRFASWDDASHIYVNEKVVPYCGLYEAEPCLVPNTVHDYRVHDMPSADRDFWSDPCVSDRLVELMVHDFVGRGINITESYDEWCKAGWALKSHPYGERMFYELSAMSSKFNAAVARQKWRQLGQSRTVSSHYLVHLYKCRVGEPEYHALCRRVWQELKT